MNAVILAVGDELTLGQAVDTNSAWLSARLAEQGVLTAYHLTVPDDQAAIARAVRDAARAAPWVLITGGLGPTPDDLTRPALAEALGVPLRLHAPSLERIERFFQRMRRPMPEANRVQAMCPEGATILENERGTAPGIRARLGEAEVFVMPGVPHEMEAMFVRHVAPLLRERSARAIATRTIRTFGAGESTVAEMLGPLMRRDRNPLVGTTVSKGVVSVRVRSDFESRAEAAEELEATCREIESRLGTLVFGGEDDSLEAAVGRLLKAGGQTLACAESCTGGLVAKLLTDVPGSSDYFAGGWVVYSNRLKQSELQVSERALVEFGAVSEAVARQMAEGALARAQADFALSLTGIAGPDGGTPDKPVGVVWIGLARREANGVKSRAERHPFAGDRELVRDRAARTALNLLRLELMGG
jgi:nicotinamide-nucleotide amidase